MTIGLLDGDMYCFRSAAASEEESAEVAILRTDIMIRDSLFHTDEFKIALSGKDNFRYKINPEYKAHRKDKPKPKYLQDCRDYVIKEFNAFVCNGYEADDFLGFNQTEDSIIFTNDKDLLMVPGAHYNPIKKTYTEVSELDGLKSFYRSMLIGDTSDNVFGIAGIGKVKSAKLIDHLEVEEEMRNVVLNLYSDPARYLMNADCLWIWRKEGETYSKRIRN